MKKLITFVFALFVLTASAQTSTFKKFYKSHKEHSQFSLNVSASMVGSFFNDEDSDEVADLLKKSGNFKLMVFDNENQEVSKDFKKYIRRNKLNTMVRVKGDDSRAEFYTLEKNNLIKEIIFKANSDDDSLVLLGLKTSMTKEELAKLLSNSDKI
jgi:hypothetical protein